MTAPDPDLQTFARALKRVWPQSVVMEEWERLHEEGIARRAMARSIVQMSRSCPGCGAVDLLSEGEARPPHLEPGMVLEVLP